MKTYNFSSTLSDEMARFIRLKHASGIEYRTEVILLLQFDKYLLSQNYKDKILSSSIFQSYFCAIKHLSINSKSGHYSVLRQFSIYLNNIKKESHLLERNPFVGNYSKPAYIYSIDEIKNILLNSSSRNIGEECVPGLYQTLFSLLYSAGIRIGEALNLNCGDYIQKEKIIHIREGKFHKERYLVLSDSAAYQLNKYLHDYSLILPLEHEAPLFVTLRKKRLLHSNVLPYFKKVLKKSGINKKARLHDFRHTFAVHRLIQWYKTEKDINVKLPLLSTYMGHVSITSTQVYLQGISELMQAGSDRFHKFILDKGVLS